LRTRLSLSLWSHFEIRWHLLSLTDVVRNRLLLFEWALICHELVLSFGWQKIWLRNTLNRLFWIMCRGKFRVHSISRLVYSLFRIHSLFILHARLRLELEFVLVANNGFSTVHLVRKFVSLDAHVRCIFLVPESWVITVWPIYCPCRLHRRWYFSSDFLLLIFYHSWYSCALLLLRFAIVITFASETIF
jgi:hypothetical protein